MQGVRLKLFCTFSANSSIFKLLLALTNCASHDVITGTDRFPISNQMLEA